MEPSPLSLPEVVKQLDTITQKTLATFGNLSTDQLNWKPDSQRWSIAQCFDHLMTTNEPYFPVFARIASGQQRNSFWERMPFLPGLFGRVLIKNLAPSSTRKLRTPKSFEPSSSELDAQIIERFILQQNNLVKALEKLKGWNLDAIKLTSPALRIITYSLRDACKIIVVHEQRHFQQAEQVLAAQGFPTS